MGVPSGGWSEFANYLYFQGWNTLFQAFFFGGSAAVGKTRRRKANQNTRMWGDTNLQEAVQQASFHRFTRFTSFH
jgi:hypothetical protein